MFYDKYQTNMDISKLIESWENQQFDKQDTFLVFQNEYLHIEQMKLISKTRRLPDGQQKQILKQYKELSGKTDEEVDYVFNNPLINFF